MISIVHKGDFRKTEKFFKYVLNRSYADILAVYGQKGVDALKNATPKRTGLTADSWSYEIEEGDGVVTITWSNSHVEKGWANIAILLQYGHGTRNGGYVQGIDYINPALAPVFQEIADKAWKEVTSG